MHKLKTIVITLLVVLILAVGGIWGYLWYSTKQQVDDIVALAKPFADISYGGIEISPAGSIGVKRLQIILNAINDAVSIGAIRLNAPNILALLNTRRQLSNGQLPPALSLSLQQLELSLDGGILGTELTRPSQRSPLQDLDALGCGPIFALGGTEWREMGYNNLVSNLSLGYRVNPNNRIELQMDSHSRDWATFDLGIDLATSAPVSSMMDLASSLTPKIAKVHAVIRDDGFNQRRNNYCAAKAGKTIDAYVNDHVRLVMERLRANGIYLGPGLTEAYRVFLAEGSRLTITASPPAPIDPNELQFYKPEDVAKLTGLTVTVNEKPVSDLSFSWDRAKLAKALETIPDSAPTPTPAPDQPAITHSPEQSTIVVQRTFHPIAVSEIDRHIGKVAKIRTNNTQYRGKLEGIKEGGFVTITIQRTTGSATLSLRRNEIIEAQILY